MKKKSYAKVNIFLKIVGTRGSYHELISRFMRVENLYDTIRFEKKDKENKEFELVGNFGCELEKNTIYKAFKLLPETNFFDSYKVVVEKKIPEFAGLGGGSSNAATFLNLANEVLELGYSKEKLANLGAKIGADVPFFIHEFKSANVSGIGEIVEEFDEDILEIETITPKIKCDTTKVYRKFRESYMDNINLDFAKGLANLSSSEILKSYKKEELNDLFLPCVDIYNELKEFDKPNWFFSGSGSTFFRHG